MDEEIRRVSQEAVVAAELARGANRRLDELATDLQDLVTGAVEKAMSNQPRISEEEREFLSLAVRSQAQRVKLRQAIIEKTIPSLVWAGAVGLFYIMKSLVEEYMKAKGWVAPWKP